MKATDKTMTVKEAEERYKVPARTIRTMAKKKCFEAVRPYREILISVESFEKWFLSTSRLV